jgi:hypothetical protein
VVRYTAACRVFAVVLPCQVHYLHNSMTPACAMCAFKLHKCAPCATQAALLCAMQVWAEDGLPPTRAAAAAFYSERKEVRYDIMPNASLNHRWAAHAWHISPASCPAGYSMHARS